ncbi:MAG: hypothetical protein JNL25_00730 [Rhodospirillaceae bacterium]|nr:hypothetical protein [Rhodospirillaceae bacterium]
MSRATKIVVIPALAAALLSASLSGCAYFSHDTRWTKAGVSEDEAWSDLDSCKRQARAATQSDRSIDQDIAATQGTGAAGTDPLQSTGISGYQTQKRYEDWVKECMIGFGYQPVP